MTTPTLIPTLKRTTILLFVVFDCLTCLCQEISERLILTDTKDSLYLHDDEPAFDTAGNYCFKIKQNGWESFVTNHGKFGKTPSIGSTYGNGGEIDYTTYTDDPINKPWYYKNTHGTKVFGPAIGKLENYITSGTRSSIAITTSYAGKVYFYANGQLVAKNAKSALGDVFIDQIDWCAFSENGNAIYYIKKGSRYYLFVNKKIIDSSAETFKELQIYNNGYYTYEEGGNRKVEASGYESESYLYTFSQDGTTKINVNGKIFPCPVPEILSPAINKEGDFSFYGIKVYYLYKYINGRQVETPISKYNVRATPLYISPKGESLHYFKTDDSIYLYRDDTLLFKPIKRQANFKIVSDNEMLSETAAENDKAFNGKSLFYLEYNDAGYWVYNGAFSKPMIPTSPYSDEKENGHIVAGRSTDSGFFSVQNISDKKYLVNINNNVYKTLHADKIFEDSFFFNEKELIFYGVKGLSIYQFKLSF